MKHSVNLLIKKKDFSPTAEKIKRITTIAAVVSVVGFLLFFAGSLWYVQTNIQKFSSMKQEVEQIEKKIAAKKQIEGLYTLTAARAETLEKILTTGSSFEGLMAHVRELQTEGIELTSVDADAAGNLSIAVHASSSASLDTFISFLLEAEKEKKLSHIIASRILRQESGDYIFLLTFAGSETLYNP